MLEKESPLPHHSLELMNSEAMTDCCPGRGDNVLEYDALTAQESSTAAVIAALQLAHRSQSMFVTMEPHSTAQRNSTLTTHELVKTRAENVSVHHNADQRWSLGRCHNQQ
jgi:hypothetical protein